MFGNSLPLPSAVSDSISSFDAELKAFHHADFDFLKNRPIWSQPVNTWNPTKAAACLFPIDS